MSGAGAPLYLTVVDLATGARGEHRFDASPVAVGADPAVDLVLPATGLVPVHGLVSFDAARVVYYDLDEGLGTTVSGAPLAAGAAAALGPGDDLLLGGRVVLRAARAPGAYAAPPPARGAPALPGTMALPRLAATAALPLPAAGPRFARVGPLDPRRPAGPFVARDLHAGGEIVLKPLSLRGRDAAAHARVREALRRLAARPCAALAPYELVELDGALHAATPRLVGEDLAAHLRRVGPMPAARAAAIGRALAEPLAALHAQGLVHGAVEPAHAFLAATPSGERIVLLGAGLPHDHQVDTTLAGGSAFRAKVAYQAPERLQGAPAAAAVDQFGLAAVLYHAVTGALPYPRLAPYPFLQAIVEGRVEPPRSHRPDLDPAFEALVLRALRLDPAARFPSIEALSAALAAF